MTEKSIFSALFPDGIIESSNKIIGLKNKLDNSIPSLLFKNGFSKMYDESKVYFNTQSRIILFYSKKESKSKKKRTEVLNKCIELKNKYPNDTVMIGYLVGTDTISEADIILQDMMFKILVGESLLRSLLPYDHILNEYKNEVNDYFNQ